MTPPLFALTPPVPFSHTGTTYLTVEHVCNNPAVVDALVAGYAQIDVALSCGSMLRYLLWVVVGCCVL